MRSRRLLPLALSIAAACSQSALLPDSPEANRSLAASAAPDGVHLENRSGAILRVAVVDSVFFENGLASWCPGQDDCGIALVASERRLIPPDEIVGPPPRQKAVQVLWWAVTPGTPEEKSGRFQRIFLRLP